MEIPVVFSENTFTQKVRAYISQAVSLYNPTLHNHIFGEGITRIVIELANFEIEPNSIIVKHLNNNGYEVEDYAAGLAYRKENEKRKYKIGKLLTHNSSLIKIFNNDPRRYVKNTKGYKIVISRNPYDIAFMSTRRGWTSCMDLEVKLNKKKEMKYYVDRGAIIAYLVKEDDLEIRNPIARIMINPYFNASEEIVYMVSKMMYGSGPYSFYQTLEEWIKTINKDRTIGEYNYHPKVHYNIFAENEPKSLIVQ